VGIRLHVANLVSPLLPQTRAFKFRSRLYRACGLKIGSDVRLNGGVVFQHPNVSIGRGTWVGRRTEFVPTPRADITVGNDCDISQDVLFITGSHDIGSGERRAGAGRSAPVAVGDGSWIGARVTFLGGSKIGRGVVVGAGSTVMDVFPDNVLIAGTPARIIREL
jgi:maltose O-acetyltransferase